MSSRANFVQSRSGYSSNASSDYSSDYSSDSSRDSQSENGASQSENGARVWRSNEGRSERRSRDVSRTSHRADSRRNLSSKNRKNKPDMSEDSDSFDLFADVWSPKTKLIVWLLVLAVCVFTGVIVYLCMKNPTIPPNPNAPVNNQLNNQVPQPNNQLNNQFHQQGFFPQQQPIQNQRAEASAHKLVTLPGHIVQGVGTTMTTAGFGAAKWGKDELTGGFTPRKLLTGLPAVAGVIGGGVVGFAGYVPNAVGTALRAGGRKLKRKEDWKGRNYLRDYPGAQHFGK